MIRSVIAAGALAGCCIATYGAVGAAQNATGVLPAVLTIHLKDFKFNPTPVTIHTGDRVTFVNDDDEAHTVTADDKSFDSEGLGGGQVWQHVFTKAGAYAYFCELHPYMKAEIFVRNSPGASQR